MCLKFKNLEQLGSILLLRFQHILHDQVVIFRAFYISPDYLNLLEDLTF